MAVGLGTVTGRVMGWGSAGAQYSEPIMPTQARPPDTPTRWSWLPSTCQVCGAWPARPLGQPVCGPCLDAFAPATARCPTCALTLSPTTPHCGECLQQAPVLAHCVAAVDYGYPWDEPIARFKFHGDTAWAHLFGALMAQAPGASELLTGCDSFIPMPLTRQRLGERGYNQAWLLARALASRSTEWGQKPQPGWLVKLRDTPPQHELDRRSRLTNLGTAFAVSARAVPELTHRRVLLIDDIMTTGATLTAAARALTMAGAAQVDALVFARTPRT